MIRSFIVCFVGVGLLSVVGLGCAGSGEEAAETTDPAAENPFFTEWDNPFGAPPFDQIVPAHYLSLIHI